MLLNALITVFALVVASALLPSIPLFILRLALRNVGWFVQRRTRSRREEIASRVQAEEKELASKRTTSPTQTQTVDEDWEKVDSSSSSLGTAGSNKTTGDEDWDGFIGFFHPFWYGISFPSPCLLWAPC